MTFDPDWRVHPGETLREVMEDRGLTMDELSRCSGIYVPDLNGILWNGAPMTQEIADRLAFCLGIKATFWMALQDYYER